MEEQKNERKNHIKPRNRPSDGYSSNTIRGGSLLRSSSNATE
jgi:hypothetical protein